MVRRTPALPRPWRVHARLPRRSPLTPRTRHARPDATYTGSAPHTGKPVPGGNVVKERVLNYDNLFSEVATHPKTSVRPARCARARERCVCQRIVSAEVGSGWRFLCGARAWPSDARARASAAARRLATHARRVQRPPAAGRAAALRRAAGEREELGCARAPRSTLIAQWRSMPTLPPHTGASRALARVVTRRC
jgi:hypothetical protein